MQQAAVTDLCQRAKSGDREAMEQLLKQYRPLMIQLAKKWSVYAFDDALQEAHIAVIEAVDLFDPLVGCYLGAFLKQRIRAHLRTWGRRQIRWVERNAVVSGEDSVPIEEWADGRDPFNRSSIEWDEWLNTLSPRERLVVEKNVIDGFSLPEIATHEGVSRHTVHTWKKRAVKKLRTKMEPVPDE